MALAIGLAGCTASAQPAPGESPTIPYATVGPSASPSPGNTLNLNITISKGQVSPNGEKIDVRRGETVVLNVLSDQDDEVHAHTGGDGHEFEVSADQPFRGQFTVPDPGSFEVESHHLNKIIVILNVR